MNLITRRIHHLISPLSVKHICQVNTRIYGLKHMKQNCRHYCFGMEEYTKLKSKEFHVYPGFGKFRSNGNVDCIIKPTNPQEFPDADRAFVFIYGKDSTQCKNVTIELTGELKDVLSLTAFPESTQMYCEIQIPIKYNLDIQLLDAASVQIFGMEADEVNITTDKGDIKTAGLKSHNIHIKTQTGNISAKRTLQGNIFITAKKTSLTAKRLQGMAMTIDAEELDTSVESSYITQGEIKANSGNIRLKNLHGCTDLVLRKGLISISGLHGQIAGFLGRGNMDVQVTEVTGNSTLHVKEGVMEIAVLDRPRHDLEVEAPSVEISSEVESMGCISKGTPQRFTLTENEDPGANKLIATVIKGSAKLKCQDWFATLGIRSR
ncbi:hypothetical protein SK128_015992 [Halocaridina rubra]|uniref:DUF4097 domain-containing protein n=1 Tax=Halocaridina rubra TaxID=373956 RepID=A0AAN8WYV5_HALRR